LTETVVNKILSDSALRSGDTVSASSTTMTAAPPAPRGYFRSGNILWVRDKEQDEVITDCRGSERTIKRYVGHNRGKDYTAIDWMARQARQHKDGNEIFTFNTGGE
jgi:hypothetical protein